MSLTKNPDTGQPWLSKSLIALGIVYGDIGTSPLYAVRECFRGDAAAIDTTKVLGILSLIFWSLTIVISVKYLLLVMRADNHGEGGILALALLARKKSGSSFGVAMVMGLFGAGLLYGDGLITPAISVLSAVEGLKVAMPHLRHLIVPISLAVLIGLFVVQPFGTAKIGRLFGPVMLLWFLVIGLLGVRGIMFHPEILAALSPHHAVGFMFHGGWNSIAILGVVFLVVTGGEALYADMGHVGRSPIRLAWFTLVLPCLLLNYFGQGALLLSDAAAADNPFYRLVPAAFQIPMVILAAIATIIASQAIITGAFSLTSQAIHIGLLPPMEVRHTSRHDIGQVYVPMVNWSLMVLVLMLVVVAGSSDRLAAAYGIAITTTMAITTCLIFFVMQRRWNWPLWLSLLIVVPLMIFDVMFFLGNVSKISAGGWFPLAVGVVSCLVMLTWRWGHSKFLLRVRIKLSHEAITELIELPSLHRVSRPAVYLHRNSEEIPHAFVSNIRVNQVLHQPVAFVTITFSDAAWVPLENRIKESQIVPGVFAIEGTYGFKQRPDIPHLLQLSDNPAFHSSDTHPLYFLGRTRLVRSSKKQIPSVRRLLFTWLYRNSGDPVEQLMLPTDDVVEIGERIET